MADLVLFWHRRDLRLGDHLGLQAARQKTPRVVGVFCFDPQILQRSDVAPARLAYLWGSVQELQRRYESWGSQLLIFQGEPVAILPSLAQLLGAEIHWGEDVEPYGRDRDHQLREVLNQEKIPYHSTWDQLLHAPGRVLTKGGTPYTVYGPFWRNWASLPKTSAVPTLPPAEGLTPGELTQLAASPLPLGPLPSLEDLGCDWERPLVLPPGETAALKQLAQFGERSLFTYDGDRNFPGMDGTSRLSAALKFGAIGIRTLWQKTEEMLVDCRSDESRNSIQTWRQELAWREFYQHCLYFFPELAEGPYRQEFKDFPWDNDPSLFQAWQRGETGYPIVDAAMRQLQETGWMHNRCRMIVASFLTKDLIIDWRWGEKHFMQTLVDGDLAANNGGWQWSASSGMDPKPLRIFNPASQAQKFDPEGDYIRLWVPELRSLDTKTLLSGNLTPFECQRYGYPQAIIDHKIQQREFKQRYKAQREKWAGAKG